MSTRTETALYEEMWAHPEYGAHSPGEQMVGVFLDIASRHGFLNAVGTDEETILDAGCGSGKGAIALGINGFRVRMCDLTDAGLTLAARRFPFYQTNLHRDLSPVVKGFGHPSRTKADFVYCCDVLEHIPTEFTMLVVDQLLRVVRYGVFLNISLSADNFGAWVGEPLHKTVRPFTWWRDNLRELGDVVEARDLIVSGVFFLRPR